MIASNGFFPFRIFFFRNSDNCYWMQVGAVAIPSDKILHFAHDNWGCNVNEQFI